jgi:hypothetical protein
MGVTDIPVWMAMYVYMLCDSRVAVSLLCMRLYEVRSTINEVE